jgi:hypothetical protein
MSEKIKITINYYKKSITIDINRSLKINFLREKALKTFYPISNTFYMFFKNQDLTPLENKSLSEVFGIKNNININLINYNDYENLPKITTKNNLKNCNECNELKELVYYCRECNEFFCKDCRINPENKHYNHNLIQLFNSENSTNKNIELYKHLLISEINNIKNNEIKKIIEYKNECIEADVLKKIINDKIERVIKLLNVKKKGFKELPEEKIVKNSSEVRQKILEIRLGLDNEVNAESLSMILKDPLIEFNKYNKWDQDFKEYKNNIDTQIYNYNLSENIIQDCDKLNNALEKNFNEKNKN